MSKPQSFASLKRHIADSVVVVLIPRDADIDAKVSVELGVCLLLGKPIIAAIQPGSTVSEKLAKIVDRFVEIDVDHPRLGILAVLNAVKELVQQIDKT